MYRVCIPSEKVILILIKKTIHKAQNSYQFVNPQQLYQYEGTSPCQHPREQAAKIYEGKYCEEQEPSCYGVLKMMFDYVRNGDDDYF